MQAAQANIDTTEPVQETEADVGAITKELEDSSAKLEVDKANTIANLQKQIISNRKALPALDKSHEKGTR